MKNEKRRKSIARAYNITSAIRKKLASKDDDKNIDLSNIAMKLADRREEALSEV